MSGIEMVRSAREDVVQLQSALTAVEAGLETVEVAAVAVDAAWQGFRRVLRVLLVISLVGLVVGVATAVVRWRRGKGVEPAPPEPEAGQGSPSAAPAIGPDALSGRPGAFPGVNDRGSGD